MDDISRLLEGFNPDGDDIDRRLLYDVTGLRIDPDEFKDESSSMARRVIF